MNRQQYKRVPLLIALLLPGLAGAANGPLKDPAIQLFLEACAVTYAHEAAVEKVVAEKGFQEMAGTDALRYLARNPGRAWAGEIDTGRYAVTLQPNGLCTVFVHSGDATQLQAAVEAWLPPAATGVKVTKQDLGASGSLHTTAYELRGGKVRERWVITLSDEPNSKLRALFSWNALEPE